MNTIDILAKLVEAAGPSDPRGKCTWTDSNGVARCNDFSEFQCQQVSGQWDQNSRCDDLLKTGE